jgi:hypothetical protein
MDMIATTFDIAMFLSTCGDCVTTSVACDAARFASLYGASDLELPRVPAERRLGTIREREL